MASDARLQPSRVDADGVHVTTTRARTVVLLALLVFGASVWLVVRAMRGEPPRIAQAETATPAVEPPAPAATAPPATAARDPEKAARILQRREERHEQRREKEEPTYTLNAPGEHAGIAAFPPPGTKPVKNGIVVPDDFELPEGYVRHYQTTDDGRQLPPILMFHPDYELTDGDGNPVAMPADRVVPPELAPAGLPRRMLSDAEPQPRTGRVVHPELAEPPARGHR